MVVIENDTFLGSGPNSLSLIEAAMISPTLALIILVTIIGNLFVIFAILLEKDLRRPQYYLIWSLALADLLVGLSVQPIAAVYELQRRWTLGVLVCDLWITSDVLVCTASILHLVAIALDRYWSVTDITYMQRRTGARILGMLAAIWVFALVLSIAPVFGWKDIDFADRVENQKICLISQAISYQIVSTMTAFYLPLIAIIFIYWRVFKAAKQRLKRSRDRKAAPSSSQHHKSSANALTVANGANDEAGEEKSNMELLPSKVSTCNATSTIGCMAEVAVMTEATLNAGTSTSTPFDRVNQFVQRKRRRKPKESAESKRERKAWRTLAIITGTFVGCWLPFFIVALIRPLVDEEDMPRVLEAFVLWLGYLNSALNPIIYTIFSPDFRQAFQRMLKKVCFWQ